MPWTAALDELAGTLEKAPAGSVAAIASASLTVEDLYMLRRLFGEVLDSERIVVDDIRRGEDDDILIRADKTANTAGASILGLGACDRKQHLGKLSEDIAGGSIQVLLVLGDALSPEALGAVVEARGRARIVVFSAFADGAADGADLAVPTASYGEFSGTWVNFQGRAQHVRKALEPVGVALETWFALAELMRRMGTEVSCRTAADVLDEAASKHPRLKVTP